MECFYSFKKFEIFTIICIIPVVTDYSPKDSITANKNGIIPNDNNKNKRQGRTIGSFFDEVKRTIRQVCDW